MHACATTSKRTSGGFRGEWSRAVDHAGLPLRPTVYPTERREHMMHLNELTKHLIFGLIACTAVAPFDLEAQQVEERGGVQWVVYDKIPMTPRTVLRPAFTVGHTSEITFGDVRGVTITDENTVLVLDHQASVIRAFDLGGNNLGIVMDSGEGPREIRSANGILVDSSGAVWVNDHGKGRFTRLLPSGDVETFPRFAGAWGFRWDGSVSEDGRIWDQRNHVSRAPGGSELGLAQRTGHAYYKYLDRTNGEVDSVFVGLAPFHYLNLERGTISVPFRNERLHTIDRSNAIWTAMSKEQYVLTLKDCFHTLHARGVRGEGHESVETIS